MSEGFPEKTQRGQVIGQGSHIKMCSIPRIPTLLSTTHIAF